MANLSASTCKRRILPAELKLGNEISRQNAENKQTYDLTEKIEIKVEKKWHFLPAKQDSGEL